MLLEHMGITFSAVPSKFEEALDPTREAHEVAKELALGKALDVAASNPNA
jgi:predicted house-cleaning NTP pyrophosphatase (Maf/HAM1 superfamily)